MSGLPRAQANKPLYIRKNPDGSYTYYQTTNVPSSSTIPIRPQAPKSTPMSTSVSATPMNLPAPKVATTREPILANTLIFYINGKKHVVADIDPRTTLNEYLRSSYGLTGTKKMCGEGGCGACTVLLTWINPINGEEVKASINSCLAPLYTIDGKSVTTIEGVGNKRDGYSEVQQKLADCNGSQCGFCSPGMVMQMQSLLANNPSPSRQMIEDHFDGNLCRCTGYRPILDAFGSFASDYNPETSRCKEKACWSGDIEDLCKPKPATSEVNQFLKQSVTQPRDVRLSKFDRQWFHPVSLSAVYNLLRQYQSKTKKLVVGNTSIGIYKETANVDVFIYIRDVAELNFTSTQSSYVSIGAAVTISKLIEFLESVYQKQSSSHSVSNLPVIIKHLYRVANFQVRNSACWAGNVMLAHDFKNFPSDIFTVMMGAGAILTIGDATAGTESSYSFSEFLQLNMQNKVIISIHIPFAKQNETLNTYKVSERHENAHAYVNASLRMTVDPTTHVVTNTPTLAFGGIRAHACRATQTESYLVGKVITNQNTLTTALDMLSQELIPDSEPGNITYRSQLSLNFFYKFYLSLQPSLPSSLESAATPFQRPVSGGSIDYDTDPIEYPVSEYIPKISGILQTSGEAHYTDDTPIVAGTYYASFVTSTNASATITNIDASVALSMPGVIDFVSASDIPGENNVDSGIGVPPEYVEPLFASNRTIYYNQPVGLIIADSHAHAHEAAKHVNITYENEQTPILTIQDAIEANSFFPNVPPFLSVEPVSSGNVEAGLSASDQVFEGFVESPSQYHFHMETHQCVVAPEEDGKILMHISTQHPAAVQETVSRVLAVPQNQITVGLLRVGGGYGAKILRSSIVGAATAVAAYKLKRPIRLVMTLNQNMEIQGKRHPYFTTYKIGVMNSGKVNALSLTYYSNGGATYDGTIGSMNAALDTSDNTYYFPNFSAVGKCCRTNLPTNTYTRAPGCLPAIYVAEAVMSETAVKLGMNVDQFREMNFYTQGQTTPVGSVLNYWNMNTIWSQIQQTADYAARRSAIDEFNQANRWVKKGMYLMPCKYGIEWAPSGFGAVIDAFADGTVQLTHTGCEVGQGINTKVSQVLAMELGCDLDLITVTSTNSQKVPGGSTTGGSITSELCSQAVIGAARKFNTKIQPIKNLFPDKSWTEIIGLAADSGLGLQSRYWQLSTGKNVPGPYQYQAYGAAISETRVDILTGEVQVQRVDILYDCGISLNPSIDIGQVEGGFVQGMGLYLTEKLEYNSSGNITTNGTWEYKPPSSKDIPIDFRVSLLKDAPNPSGVLSSKASGEPPMTLSASVYFAVKEAIMDARKAAGLSDPPILPAPATPNVVGVSAGTSISLLSLS